MIFESPEIYFFVKSSLNVLLNCKINVRILKQRESDYFFVSLVHWSNNGIITQKSKGRLLFIISFFDQVLFLCLAV